MPETAFCSYAERGFAIFPAAISPEGIGEACAALDRIRTGAALLPESLRGNLTWERDLPAAKRGGIAPEETGDALFLAGDLPAFDPAFAGLFLSLALLDPVRRLLGTADVRHHFSNATIKSPRVGSGVSWHRDFPNGYLCPRSASFVRLMVCLDGMDAGNGATRFVRDSHFLSDEAAQGADASAADEAAAPGARIEEAHCLPGSVVAIHPKVVHGGPPNTSSRPRRNLLIQWGRADDPLPERPAVADTLTGLSPSEIEAWLAER